nr:replication initiator protein A [uncultured Fusobacterium sp.]
MKKEKKINELEDVEKIEIENFDISETGSLSDDLISFEKLNDIKIQSEELPDIEVQEIYIRETGNYLNLQENFINVPIEMISFPFFTPQKQNKRVNFKYTFEDLGVTMYSTLVPKSKKDKVFQPSILEEKIYTFLITMYQEELSKKKDNNDEEVAIEFEISDFIVKFLGNKMNRTYYSKVEQALKNLKNTIYQFEISNHTKFGRNKFEDSSFQLLNYQKLKNGKKIYYRVLLNKNIVNKIKSKRYIKYNTKNLLEIMIKDPIASRIYKYISMIRFEKNSDKINVRTLAAIIPLKIEQRVERKVKSGTKEYYLNRMKPVLLRILKAFEILLNLNYLTSFEEKYVKEEGTYYISYVFNKERDGDCHMSEFVKKKKEKKIVKEIIDGVEEIIDVNADIEYQDNVEYLIKKAKENPKISEKWNKWVENKINKISEGYGDEILKRILTILIHLDKNIEKSLPSYIDGILKNLRTAQKTPKIRNMTVMENVNKGKGLKNKAQINQARKKDMEKIKNIEEIRNESNLLEKREKKLLIENKNSNENQEKNHIVENNILSVEEILNAFDEETRNIIEEKAIELLKTETENIEVVLNAKKNSKNIYHRMMSSYIMRIIKKEYNNDKK